MFFCQESMDICEDDAQEVAHSLVLFAKGGLVLSRCKEVADTFRQCRDFVEEQTQRLKVSSDKWMQKFNAANGDRFLEGEVDEVCTFLNAASQTMAPAVGDTSLEKMIASAGGPIKCVSLNSFGKCFCCQALLPTRGPSSVLVASASFVTRGQCS